MFWNPDDEHKSLMKQIHSDTSGQFKHLDSTTREEIGKVTTIEAQLSAWVFESHCWMLKDKGSAVCEWCGEKVSNYQAPLDRNVWLSTSKVCGKVIEYIKATDRIRDNLKTLMISKGDA